MLCAALVSIAACADVITWPAAEGTAATDGEYRVSVNGRPLDVVYIPKPSMHDNQLTGDENLQPYYAAFFDADEEVTVVVESPKDMANTRILPVSKGVRPLVESAHRVVFKARPPFKLSLEPSPRHRALVFSACLPEKNVPVPGARNVRYFGPGRHHYDKPICLNSNETMYLAPGAWVESAVFGVGTNITVRGRGVLSGLCWDWCKGPSGHMMHFGGNNISLRDFTIVGAWQWCVVLDSCENAVVDGLNILNGHVLNDDGIDICRSRNVTIRNTFIRSQDDCITPKYWLEGFKVENVILWTDVANIFRIGYECEGPSRKFSDFHVKGVDVLHQSIHKPPTGALWSENVVYIQASNDMLFENMLFEDFRIDGSEPGDNLINVRTLIIRDQWQQHKNPGRVRNVRFRNFSFAFGLPPKSQSIYLESIDDAHTVEGVRFEAMDPRLEFKTKGKVKYEKGYADKVAGIYAEAISPWTIRVTTDGLSGDFVIDQPLVKTVVDERIPSLPPVNESRRGFGKRVKLNAIRSCECSVKDALIQDSVVVRDTTGMIYSASSDYRIDPDGWGAIEACPMGRIGTNKEVLVSYAYRQQRIDTVVRTVDGRLALRRGEDCTRLPKPAKLLKGDDALVNVWVSGDSVMLMDDNLYPVLESASDVATSAPASVVAPRTLAKLKAGDKVKILAWGDSVTACGYLPDSDKWQEQFVRRLRANYPKAQVELVSVGWGGKNTRSFLGLPYEHQFSYERVVLGAKPDLVISEFVNDSGIAEDDVEKIYGKYLEDFRNIGAEWIVLTPHYTRPDWLRVQRAKGNDTDPRGYVRGLRTFAAKHNVGLADASIRWGHLWREGIPYQTMFCNDINHPDAVGMGFFADALMALFANNGGSGSLYDGFVSPSKDYGPHTWWHWMNGNVSKEGLVADLDAMAAIGVAGVHIFDAGCDIPEGPLKFNSPEWYDTIKFAVEEAQKRNMMVVLPNCSGYSVAGGPWITADNAMKTVAYTIRDVEGGQQVVETLEAPWNPVGFYEDIAVLAYPVPKPELSTMELAGVKVTNRIEGNVSEWMLDFPSGYTASDLSFKMTGRGWSHSCNLKLECLSSDGKWKEILYRKVFPVNQGQTIRNVRDYGFPESSASKWRVRFGFASDARQFPISEVRLSKAGRIEDIAERAWFVRCDTQTAPIDVNADQVIALDSVTNLTANMDSSGKLTWNAPDGIWRIVRIGYTANGKCCHPASKFGVGFECDKLAKRGIDTHFDAYIGKLCDHLGTNLYGNVKYGFKGVLIDSWEAGTQNWTQGFEREFLARKGYDIIPYLPILTGAIVGGNEVTEKVIADYRNVLSNMFAENFSDEFARKCHERGLEFWTEAYGTFNSTEELYGRSADVDMGEFWIKPLPFSSNCDACVPKVAYRAHRKNPSGIIAAESFTGWPTDAKWQQDPFSFKARGDLMYARGVNRIVYHRYAHQPWTKPTYYPGMTMGQWGVHFERTETWWYEAKDWISYETRCQYLLQQGEYVNEGQDNGVVWTHRCLPDGSDAFFVATAENVAKEVWVTLPYSGRAPEIWDAESGARYRPREWRTAGDATSIRFKFKPAGSAFVVFPVKKVEGLPVETLRVCESECQLTSPWKVSFEATYPAPMAIVLNELKSLSEHDDPEVRYFSGKSIYCTTFDFSRKSIRPGMAVVLDLGEVKNLATVLVNGREFPVCWRPPFRVDVTDALREGSNDLQVKITNLWVNRLIGDESKPADVKWRGNRLDEIPAWVKEGKPSPTGRNTFTTWHHWRKGDQLPASGLLGPVKLAVEIDG